MPAYTVQSDHPVPVINVVIVNDQGELLLTRRAVEPFRGAWTLVGGRIDVQDDCAEMTTVREVKEETGLDVAVTHLLGVESGADPRFFVVKVIYVARVTGGELTVNPEADAFRWVSFEDAFREPLGFDHHDVVALYGERKDSMIPIAERSRYAEWYGKDYPFVMAEYPRFASLAIIVNENKEILLAHRARKPFAGFWDLPGGHLYVGETPEDCLRREVREELGVDCTVGELFHTYSDKGQNPRNADVAAAYRATIHSQQFVKNIEMDDFQYFRLDQIPPMAYKNDLIIRDVARRLV